MISRLTKIANQLDQKGLYIEADIIDLLLKQAIEEGPEYYGFKSEEEKPKMMDLPESGIMTPEQYKRYYGKERPEQAKEVEEQKQPEESQEESQEYKYDEFIQWLKNFREDRIKESWTGRLDAIGIITSFETEIQVKFDADPSISGFLMKRIILNKESKSIIDIFPQVDDDNNSLVFDFSSNTNEKDKILSLIDEYLLEADPARCRCGDWQNDYGQCLSSPCGFEG